MKIVSGADDQRVYVVVPYVATCVCSVSPDEVVNRRLSLRRMSMLLPYTKGRWMKSWRDVNI